MNNVDIDALLAEAEALVKGSVKRMPKIDSIKPKKAPVVKAGKNFRYEPATYNELHKMENWVEVKNAAEHSQMLYAELKKRQAAGEWVYIALDTETYAIEVPASQVPAHIVRRYVQKHPQDLPFALSIATLTHSYIVFDDDIMYYKDIIEDETIDKVLHNTKFDYHILANYGIDLHGKIWDTLVMIKLINENLKSYALKDLALRIYQDANKWEIMKDNWMQEHRCVDWRKVPRELMADYAAGDTWWTIKLFEKYYPKLAEYDLTELYNTESALIYVLAKMERRGFRVNKEYLVNLGKEFEVEVADKTNALFDKVGYIFNPNSSQQLYKMFLEQGVSKDAIKVNEATNNPILDKDAMEILAESYPIAADIMYVRKLSKLQGTFVDGVKNILDSENRVHGNFNQTEATTGRMSSTQPNLQNIPNRDKRIKKAYIPKDGYCIFSFDLKAIEYRGFAHYSRAQGLIDAIKRGHDVHTATASIVFDVPYDDVTKEQRQRAKTINFSLIYGQGDAATAHDLKVDISEARAFKRKYFSALPEAKPFLNTVQQTCKDKGYVRNYFKRRRHLKQEECYKSVNALIQGWAADYMKSKMVLVGHYLDSFDSGLVSVVHDDLLVEMRLEEVETIVPVIKSIIDDYTTFRVPILAGCEFGLDNWSDRDEYDLTKSFEENCRLFREKRENK